MLFVIVKTTSIDYSVEVSQPFSERKDARECLRAMYENLKTEAARELKFFDENSQCGAEYYHVNIGDNWYHATIKEIAESVDSKTTLHTVSKTKNASLKTKFFSGAYPGDVEADANAFLAKNPNVKVENAQLSSSLAVTAHGVEYPQVIYAILYKE